MKKILILHASAGAGHQRAAEALSMAFAQEGANSLVEDILHFTPPWFRKTYAGGYLNMVRTTPEVWGYVYGLTDRQTLRPWQKRIRTTFNKFNTLRFASFLHRMAPDGVVCTHFMPLDIVAGLRQRGLTSAPVYGAVTDFAAHSLWVCPNVDGYFVATEEARRDLIRRGSPAQGIRITGIPVDPRFASPIDPESAKRRLGLATDRPTVLLLCGGFGVGPIEEMVHSLGAEPIRIQVVVITGRNEPLRQAVLASARSQATPIVVHGYVNNMHDFIAASDLVVSKPGGLTASEVLAQGKPLVITQPIPGQEQRNAECLLEAGAAVRLFEPADAAWKIRSLLESPPRMKALQGAATCLARPQAAVHIARHLLATLEDRPILTVS